VLWLQKELVVPLRQPLRHVRKRRHSLHRVAMEFQTLQVKQRRRFLILQQFQRQVHVPQLQLLQRKAKSVFHM
jgi:hypothetical protein